MNFDMNTPFSVLIAVYCKDDPRLFRVALDSIYSNTLTPAEVILIQDGPIGDKLLNVIALYSNRAGFKCITLSKNCGLALALNVGLAHITTRYVFRADSDDFNLPNRFEKQLRFLLTGYDLVGGSILEVSSLCNPIAVRKVPRTSLEIRRFIGNRNPFNHMTVAFRYDVVKKLGGYPNIYLKEDYGLWILMIANGAKAMNIEDVVVHATAGPEMYRRRGGIKYVKSEIELQLLLVKTGLQHRNRAFIIGAARALIFLLPATVRGMIYEKFLRTSA